MCVYLSWTNKDTIENFYIHAEFNANNHLNDNQNIFPNTFFDTLLNTHRP